MLAPQVRGSAIESRERYKRFLVRTAGGDLPILHRRPDYISRSTSHRQGSTCVGYTELHFSPVYPAAARMTGGGR